MKFVNMKTSTGAKCHQGFSYGHKFEVDKLYEFDLNRSKYKLARKLYVYEF